MLFTVVCGWHPNFLLDLMAFCFSWALATKAGMSLPTCHRGARGGGVRGGGGEEGAGLGQSAFCPAAGGIRHALFCLSSGRRRASSRRAPVPHSKHKPPPHHQPVFETRSSPQPYFSSRGCGARTNSHSPECGTRPGNNFSLFCSPFQARPAKFFFGFVPEISGHCSYP